MARYCQDVIYAQIVAGHDVGLMYPGHFDRGPVRIKHKVYGELRLYEVVNPLPVALSFGVAGPLDYMAPLEDLGPYQDVLANFRPDVIHVHEIMGIHKEFFLLVKDLGIPMVYTTHDYYPICMRCTFVTGCGSICQDGPSGIQCARCNARSGLTLRRSRIMQSPIFSIYKHNRVVNKLIKGVLCKKPGQTPLPVASVDDGWVGCNEKGYGRLIEYNQDILNTMDAIFANSDLAGSVYAHVVDPAIIYRVPITHAGISRAVSAPARAKANVIHFAYLGGPKEYKGCGCLLEALSMLRNDTGCYTLHLFGDGYPKIDAPNVEIHDTLSGDEVGQALAHMDAVIVPSICPETFGFVVLEALAAGAHVICSDSVGAKDLVDSDYVFMTGDASDLAKRMHDFLIHAEDMCRASLRQDYPLDIAVHVQELAECYEKVRVRICR